MRTHYLYLLAGLFALLGGCSRCEHKDDPQPACPEGRIIIQEEPYDSLGTTRYGLTSGTLRFSASLPYDSYAWTIGQDGRTFSQAVVDLNFGFASNGPLPVRLIGKRTPMPCRPGDTGIDTLYSSFTILNYSSSPMFGTYTGTDEGNPDKPYTVRIWKWFRPDGVCNLCRDTAYSINGFANNFYEFKVEPYLGGMNAQIRPNGPIFKNSYGESIFNMFAHLSDDLNTITIRYRSALPGQDSSQAGFKYRTFTGKRQ